MPRRTRFSDIALPRLLNEDETAHYLGMSRSDYGSRIADLEDKHCFPRRHTLLNKRDRHAIDAWLDSEFGISEKNAMLDAQINARIGAMGHG